MTVLTKPKTILRLIGRVLLTLDKDLLHHQAVFQGNIPAVDQDLRLRILASMGEIIDQGPNQEANLNLGQGLDLEAVIPKEILDH
jgi:hypothetical protein